MAERKAFLEEIYIKNFLSLRDVTLPFKPLTVLVGPNASGKSNTLSALNFLSKMIVDEKLPFYEDPKDTIWIGGTQKITFLLQTKIEENQTVYNLKLKAESNYAPYIEQLSVNGVEVVSIRDGKGDVKDENGENETTYNSNKLALGSAGNYGNKPITRALAEFVMEWQIYDFSTNFIRSNLASLSPTETDIQEFPKLDCYGINLPKILWNWHKYSPESFQIVSESLAVSTDRQIDQYLIDGKNQLCLIERNNEPIPLHSASDGILRLIAYNILLNEPELPPLIAIEEPERNLHPSALTDIAHVLEQIAQYSQVIITTHSSQLLGAFNPESLGDALGVLLLRNLPGFGTEVLNLEDYLDEREALKGWIDDFGIGSAIFDSELLQDVMEDKS